jgi:hypothetical protein
MVMLPGRRARVRLAREVGFARRFSRSLLPLLLCVTLFGGAAPRHAAGASSPEHTEYPFTRAPSRSSEPALVQRERGPVSGPSLLLQAGDLAAGSSAGVTVDPGGVELRLSEAPLTREDESFPLFGVAESAPLEFAGPSVLSNLVVEAESSDGAAVEVEVRGRIGTRWTEWRAPRDLEELEGASALQMRVTLMARPGAPSPRVTAIRGTLEAWHGVRAAQVSAAAAAAPTTTVMATRIGMAGRTTANGHVITERDHFVALPSKRALNSNGGTDYMVQLSYRGRTATVPVWDIGPWNIADDYWNETRERFSDLPRWTSQAEAAFFTGYNGGRDATGRTVILPNSIDIADGTFLEDLGMTQNDWVDVTFLWVSAPSPARRPTPAITPKSATNPGNNQPGPSGPSTPTRAASYNAPMPGSPVYLPLVTQDPSGWDTSWSIQNPTASAVTGVAELYDATGAHAGQLPFTLPPWGSDTYAVSDVIGPAASFTGSVAIRASGPVAVIANGDHSGMDRMSYEAVSAGAALLAAPLILKDRDGWSTGVQVQNLGQVPTTVRITYVGVAGAVADESAMIGPLASHTFFQPANAALPRGFVGSATIQSTNAQPLAAVVAATAQSGGALAYAAISVGADSLHAPILYRRYNGWDSSMQIQNLNPAPARVTIAYQSSGPTPGGGTEALVIPGGGSITLNQAAQPLLPDGFVGSARIVAEPGARLAGVVSQVQPTGGAAMNYVLGRPLSMTVAAPLITKGSEGWSAGIQAQNPNLAPAGLVLTVYDESGTQIHSLQDVIEPGGTRTYYPPAIPEIPSGFRGSAIVQATTGQPIAVVVNETAR